jgi:hypothetical protein
MKISSSNNTSNDGHTPAKRFKGFLPRKVSESDEQLPKSGVTILHLTQGTVEYKIQTPHFPRNSQYP